jgi:hypothetical protein
MAKFYSMLTFLIVTVLLFNFAGVMTSTGYIINIAMHPDQALSSPLLLALGLIFLGLGGVGIFIGTFITNSVSNSWQSAMAIAIIPALFTVLVGDMISIWLKVSEFNSSVATLICGTLLVAWIFGIMDWWRQFQ